MASILSPLLLLLFSFTHQINSGSSLDFTVDLIQRDSPNSPLYDSSLNHFDRLRNAFRRSSSRIHRYEPRKYSSVESPSSSSSSVLIQSTIVAGPGEYLMNISIGTPPVVVLGIADTGSDLIWTQCKPCTQCFTQDPPMFDPKESSTYRSVPCDNSACTRLLASQATCGSLENSCQYTYSYGDNSFSRGDLATETMTFATNHHHHVSINTILFGCGHENGGSFDESGSGLIGLGGGPLSLVSQMVKSNGDGKIFSYCLVPLSDQSEHTSKITFGNRSTIAKNGGAISTPLVAKQPETFYYVTLDAISVGNKRMDYKNWYSSSSTSKIASEKGNIIMDSGTTLTFLPSGFFEALVSALEEAISAERVEDPNGLLSLCFRGDGDGEQVPTITAHFSGGDLVLQPLNAFAKVEDDVFCLTMLASEQVAIFGNMAQMNFFVEYDLKGKSVSFLPTDCTKQY